MFDIKNIIERFAWTFIQAFIGSLPMTVNLTSDAFSGVGWSGLTAGLAAIISLAKNLTAEGIVVEEVKRAL